MPAAARACFGGAAALAGGTVAAAVGHFASDCAVAAGIAVVLSAGSLPTAAAEVDAAERGTDQFESTLMGDLYGFAPPPSLVKCVGATLAGSMFAVLGMIAEGRRERRRKEEGGRKPAATAAKRPQAGPAAAASAPEEVASSPESQKPARRPAQAEEGGPNGQKPAWRRGSATRAEEEGTPAATPSGGSRRSPECRPQARPGPPPAPSAPLRPFRPGASLSEAQKAEREIKSALNKLTRDKFDTLYEQIFRCLAKSEDKAEITGVIAREVFSKATMQQCFVEMYADLCARLHADMKKANIEADFKRSLLDRCQQSFNAHLEPPGIDECLDYEEQYEMLVKYKTRMTGTVRLIGHLLRQRMLSPKFIFVCAEELLEIGSPEALETLCAFLETIGSTFDAQEWQGRARLEEVFVRARRYSEDPERPQRSRCLLKDLLDLRQRQWKARIIKEPEVAAPPQRAPEGQRAAQDSNWRAPRDPARAEEPRAHPSPQGGRASIGAGADEAGLRRSRTCTSEALPAPRPGTEAGLRRSRTWGSEAPPRSPVPGGPAGAEDAPWRRGEAAPGPPSAPRRRALAPGGAGPAAAPGTGAPVIGSPPRSPG